MSSVEARDLALERRERERFAVLSHVLARSRGDVGAALLGSRIADDLGLDRQQTARVLTDLMEVGYLADAGGGPSVSITPQGILYLQRRAGRRRSVRAAVRPMPAEQGIRAAVRRALG